MKRHTSEWVEKAEDDFRTAVRESRVRKNPSYNSVCFHCQQCGEKYLKARLVEADAVFARTHNLITLFEQVLLYEPFWEALRPHLETLNAYSTDIRYPGDSAVQEEAKEAMKSCRTVRREIRHSLGIES